MAGQAVLIGVLFSAAPTGAVVVRKVISLVVLFGLGLGGVAYAQQLKKVRISSKAAGESMLPYVIAQRLGFYREEGIDIEVIVARGTVATQALISGSVDYSNASVIPAILGGARLKIILINADKPAHYLVTSSKISTIRDLIGKNLAISDFSGNSTLILREFLNAKGIPADRVKLITAFGDPSVRLGALLGGAVDAAPLTYELAKVAEAKGYRILAHIGDYVSSLNAALVSTDQKIETPPEEVFRVVRATLKGQLFMYRNTKESIKFFAEVLGIKDIDLARELWEDRLRNASEIARIGRATEQAMTRNIERVKEQMQLAGAKPRSKGVVGPRQVYDFSFAERAYEELGAIKWDPNNYQYSKKK